MHIFDFRYLSRLVFGNGIVIQPKISQNIETVNNQEIFQTDRQAIWKN